jgi:hypothetical protein
MKMNRTPIRELQAIVDGEILEGVVYTPGVAESPAGQQLLALLAQHGWTLEAFVEALTTHGA